jgi:hypothetical protein
MPGKLTGEDKRQAEERSPTKKGTRIECHIDGVIDLQKIEKYLQ